MFGLSITNNDNNDDKKDLSNDDDHELEKNHNKSSITSSLSKLVVLDHNNNNADEMLLLDKTNQQLQHNHILQQQDGVLVGDDDNDPNRMVVRIKATITTNRSSSSNHYRHNDKQPNHHHRHRDQPVTASSSLTQDFSITIHLDGTVEMMKRAVIDGFLSPSTTPTNTSSSYFSGKHDCYNSYYVRLIAAGRLLTPDNATLQEFQQQFMQCNRIIHAVIMESKEIYKQGAQALLQQRQQYHHQQSSPSQPSVGGTSVDTAATTTTNTTATMGSMAYDSFHRQQQLGSQHHYFTGNNVLSNRRTRRHVMNGLLRGTGVNESGWAIARNDDSHVDSSSYSSESTDDDDEDEDDVMPNSNYQRYDDVQPTGGRYGLNVNNHIIDNSSGSSHVVSFNRMISLEDDVNSVLDDTSTLEGGNISISHMPITITTANCPDIEQGVLVLQDEEEAEAAGAVEDLERRSRQLPNNTSFTVVPAPPQQQYPHHHHHHHHHETNLFGNNHRQRRRQNVMNNHHPMNENISTSLSLFRTNNPSHHPSSRRHHHHNREYRGFDTLRNYGLHRNEITILRNYFNHNIDRWLLNHPEIVAEVERYVPYDVLLRRRHYEEAWMNVQGPYSEFRMNLNFNNSNHNNVALNNNNNNNISGDSLFASLPSIASSYHATATTAPATNPTNVMNHRGAGELQMFGTHANSNYNNAWTSATLEEQQQQQQQQNPSLLWNNNNATTANNNNMRSYSMMNPHNHNNGFTSTTMGTDRDFLWGFMLGFFVGFIMLVWLWIPTVPHKQKLGILTGYSFHLALGIFRNKNNQNNNLNNNDQDYYYDTDELTLLKQYRNTNMLLLED